MYAIASDLRKREAAKIQTYYEAQLEAAQSETKTTTLTKDENAKNEAGKKVEEIITDVETSVTAPDGGLAPQTDQNNDGVIDQRDAQIVAINQAMVNNVGPDGQPLSDEAKKKLIARLGELKKVLPVGV